MLSNIFKVVSISANETSTDVGYHDGIMFYSKHNMFSGNNI